ncbi:MAG: spore germination protein GerW family protein [Candidatus Zixiibacteriota bacterium]
MPNNVMEVISGIVGELKQIASAETIIGEAVTVGNKTVIPIVKISVGFGAGGGEGEKEKTVGGYGAGGGGGCIVEPAAFIIMDESGISLLPAKPGKIDSIVEAIPGVVSKIMNLKKKLKKSDNGDSDKGVESTDE